MELKKGYKQTEVGVIPEDWEVCFLGNLLKGIADVDHYMPKTENYGVPYVMTGDLKDCAGDIDFESCKKISYDDYEKLSKKVRNVKGDIILARYATVGTVSYVNIDFDFVVSYSCVTIKPDKSRLIDWYLYYYFKSHIFRLEVKNKVNANIQDNVGIGDLVKMLIPLPSTLAEQTAIATVLSDTDELISSLERLIAKKQAIKQGAMQELLTGRTRLPGFQNTEGYKQTEVGIIPSEWNFKKLAEITTLITNGFVGTATSHYSNDDGSILYIQGYNVEENGFNLRGIKYVTKEFHKQHQRSCLQENDLLTIQTGDVGLTTIVTKKLVGSNCHALIITRFKKEHFFPKYFSYYFNSSSGRARLKEIETGTTMKHINVSELLQFLVPIPPTIAEQTAIAETLSNIDAEIEALDTKLQKLKSLKQGMMQELLTGKTRLIKKTA